MSSILKPYESVIAPASGHIAVYILKCADRTFYTGITTDVTRRVREHNDSVLGAKYTRGRRPVKLVFVRQKKNKSLAVKAE